MNEVVPGLLLEETFYVSEYGFDFIVKTGVNLTGMVEGDLKGVIRRPNGSVAVKNIPFENVVDLVSGTILFPVAPTDFTTTGLHTAQVFVKDVALNIARPSHPFSFEVQKPLGGSVPLVWS